MAESISKRIGAHGKFKKGVCLKGSQGENTS